MKKRIRPSTIILIAVIALVLGSIGYVIFQINHSSRGFRPPVVPLEENVSPISHQYSRRILEKLGYPVKIFNFPYNRDIYKIVIRRYDKDDDWETWGSWLEQGNKLILLCYRIYESKKLLSVSSSHPLLDDIDSLHLSTDVHLGNFKFPFDNTHRQWVLTDHDRPLIMHDNVGKGEIIYIADAAAFTDESIIKGQNIFLLNNCLKNKYPETVVFDFSSKAAEITFRSDFENSGPLDFLLRRPFLPLLLQAFFLGLVFCLVFWKRFGPPRDLDQFSKRSLLRHLTAAGNFYEKTKNPQVFADILDRAFFSRLRGLLRTSGGSPEELKSEAKRRLHLSLDEEDAFSIDATKNLVARDDRREQIILRLKGVEQHHGKNKNTG